MEERVKHLEETVLRITARCNALEIALHTLALTTCQTIPPDRSQYQEWQKIARAKADNYTAQSDVEKFGLGHGPFAEYPSTAAAMTTFLAEMRRP